MLLRFSSDFSIAYIKTVFLFLLFAIFDAPSGLASELIIIRHGEAENNIHHIFNSNLLQSFQYPLTTLGLSQVLAAGQMLKEVYHYDNSTIEQVYCSPLLRTYATAAVLVETLGINQEKVVIEGLLREAGVGRLEGLVRPDSWDHSQAKQQYEAEKDEDISVRMRLFLDKIKSQKYDQTILVVTHAAPARQLQILLTSDSDVSRYNNAEFRVINTEHLHESSAAPAQN
jgi:broad specificity phosphatase PhoE